MKLMLTRCAVVCVVAVVATVALIVAVAAPIVVIVAVSVVVSAVEDVVLVVGVVITVSPLRARGEALRNPAAAVFIVGTVARAVLAAPCCAGRCWRPWLAVSDTSPPSSSPRRFDVEASTLNQAVVYRPWSSLFSARPSAERIVVVVVTCCCTLTTVRGKGVDTCLHHRPSSSYRRHEVLAG